MTKHTIDIRPTPTLIEQAFERFGVPLGGALKLDAKGTLSCTPEAEDFPEVMSKLTGLLLADFATATMVLPSNVRALRGAVETMESLLRSRRAMGPRRRWETSWSAWRVVADNLDGLANASIIGPE
jgi:hypothetical protein